MSEHKRAFGLKSLIDPRLGEFPKAVFSPEQIAALPKKVDYSYDYPKIDNQFQFGTCVAFGTKKVFEFFYKKRNNKPILISANAIFSGAKNEYYPTDLTDDGIEVSDGLNILKQYYVLDSALPYQPNNFAACVAPVPDDLKKTDFLFQDFVSVNPTVEEIKLALYHHGVVAIGIDFSNEWMQPPTNGVLQPHNLTSAGGHCISLAGYDDDIDVGDGTNGAFLLINSWSTDWALGGKAWLPYSSDVLPSDVFTVKA